MKKVFYTIILFILGFIRVLVLFLYSDNKKVRNYEVNGEGLEDVSNFPNKELTNDNLEKNQYLFQENQLVGGKRIMKINEIYPLCQNTKNSKYVVQRENGVITSLNVTPECYVDYIDKNDAVLHNSISYRR